CDIVCLSLHDVLPIYPAGMERHGTISVQGPASVVSMRFVFQMALSTSVAITIHCRGGIWRKRSGRLLQSKSMWDMCGLAPLPLQDRKSTRLNSSHVKI